MNEQALRTTLNRLKDFIRELYEADSESMPLGALEPFVAISAVGKGSITIWGESLKKYYECVDKIFNVISGDPEKRKSQQFKATQLSKQTANNYIDNAILDALGIDPSRGKIPIEDKTDFESRLKIRFEELINLFIMPSTPHEVYLHVKGVNLRKECFCFGGVRFFPSDKENKRLFRKQLAIRILSRLDSSETKKVYLKHFQKATNQLWDQGALCTINVKASDGDAAYLIAREAINRAIEVLNFYSILMHSRNKHIYAFFAGEAEVSAHSIAFSLNNKGGFHLALPLNPPDDLFVLSRLNEYAVNWGLPRASNILERSRYERLGTFENRLLGALRFAGRATACRVNEDAFLHYAVALECLLGDTSASGEITYKLALRCAHLLGKEPEARKDISQKIKSFYGIRSAIVHRAEDTVTDKQLAEFHYYVRNALIKALTAPEFAEIKDEKDFLDILEQRILL